MTGCCIKQKCEGAMQVTDPERATISANGRSDA